MYHRNLTRKEDKFTIGCLNCSQPVNLHHGYKGTAFVSGLGRRGTV